MLDIDDVRVDVCILCGRHQNLYNKGNREEFTKNYILCYRKW